jgi:hypothetical protein
MFVLIAMGEEPQNIEIPCMFFETRQDAEEHLGYTAVKTMAPPVATVRKNLLCM